MKDLDKELDKVLDNAFTGTFVDAWKTEDGIVLDTKYREQIKTVILEALKAEMPKELKSFSWGEDSDKVTMQPPEAVMLYNKLRADCLEVCNKLLGDSNE